MCSDVHAIPRLYPSIPHLPGSRCADDRTVSTAQARRCTDPAAASGVVIVQEKLDGSCVAVVREERGVVARGREGRLAAESGNEARRWFAAWVAERAALFEAVLAPGEILAGEWLALVHGTRYALPHGPFVPFDVFCNEKRLGVDALAARLAGTGLPLPHEVHRGAPIAVADAARALGQGGHGAIDLPEGLVYRVERGGEVVLVAKWVRPGKVDGCYLPENSGAPALHHWTPP